MKRNVISLVCSCFFLSSCLSGCQSVQQPTAETIADSTSATAAGTTTPIAETITETTTTTETLKPFDYTLCFSGDICMDENAYTTQYWRSCGEDITRCIDATMVEHMQSADICFINNEFPYSERGSATVGKDYTYRANPDNVKALLDLGVDIVSLANNHAYDYGEDALLDTLDTLQNAGIPYVGAGKNLEEASSIYYYELDGFTVAFVSGTRVEWAELTKGATETDPGVFRTVDPTLLYERVEEADQNADYVVVYMHWGIEGVTYLEEYQQTTGNGLIDAGADVVIGDHTHCLQGIDFYKEKPILYSMGNYWFNGMTMDTMLAELHISGTAEDYSVQLQLVPAVQTNSQVISIEDADAQDTFYRNMEAMSYGISIDSDGIVTDSDNS